MGFEIPKEEVERMKPEDFLGTYTYDTFWCWIQYNEKLDVNGDLEGLKVEGSGSGVTKRSWWGYSYRNQERKHYRTLEDLVQDCHEEELLNSFLKEHCQ